MLLVVTLQTSYASDGETIHFVRHWWWHYRLRMLLVVTLQTPNTTGGDTTEFVRQWQWHYRLRVMQWFVSKWTGSHVLLDITAKHPKFSRCLHSITRSTHIFVSHMNFVNPKTKIGNWTKWMLDLYTSYRNTLIKTKSPPVKHKNFAEIIKIIIL